MYNFPAQYVDGESITTLQSRKTQLEVYENVFKHITVSPESIVIQKEIGAGEF